MPKLTYDEAVERLASPSTWCEGAAALAERKDPHALVPVVKAYERKAEGTNVQCLLDAIAKLGEGADLVALQAGADEDGRRALYHAMELLPADRWLAALQAGADEANAKTQRQALRALAAQRQTAAWIAAMVKLLDAPAEPVRAQAIESLGRRQDDVSRAALRDHASKETSPRLKAMLERAIAPR